MSEIYHITADVFSANHSDFKQNKCSAVAEMGDRLATIDIGQKLGELCPFGGGGELGPHLTQCGQGRGLFARQVSS